MTMGFKQQIGGKPSLFVEKIWSCLRNKGVCFEFENYLNSRFSPKVRLLDLAPKMHSIRAGHRWRAGMDIHMVINNRTKDRLQFAPVVKVVSVQDIIIIPTEKKITVDCWLFSPAGIEILAGNDGFNCVEDFWAYFKEPFSGQIIHWTGLQY